MNDLETLYRVFGEMIFRMRVLQAQIDQTEKAILGQLQMQQQMPPNGDNKKETI